MTATTQPSKTANPMAHEFRHRDFRLLWLEQATSLLGDQFAMIATPWLVLRLINDPLVLALVGIPRAVFILLGGAIVDRFSSRLVMIASWQRILAASQSIHPLGVVFNLSEVRPQASSLVF